MAGRSSKATALTRYQKALEKVDTAEGRVKLARAEADLEAQRFILHGGTQAELDAVTGVEDSGE